MADFRDRCSVLDLLINAKPGGASDEFIEALTGHLAQTSSVRPPTGAKGNSGVRILKLEGEFSAAFGHATRGDCDLYVIGEAPDPETQEAIVNAMKMRAFMGAAVVQIAGLWREETR